MGIITWLVLFSFGASGVLAAWIGVREYASQSVLFWIYTVGAAVVLAVTIMLENKHKIVGRIAPQKGESLYKKIPFDVAILLLGFTVILTLLTSQYRGFFYYGSFTRGLMNHLFNVIIVFGLCLMQGIYFYRRFTDFASLEADWKNALVIRFLRTIRDFFANIKVVTKVFVGLTAFFLFGLVTGLTGVESGLLTIMLIGFFLVIVPLFIIIIKKVGQFNKILIHANAIANGHLKPDLEVKGKSELAKLASSINKMKNGVKASQNEQAKSERLKTELITNVSHDLRTPLTNIMNYAEHLKDPNLTEEERLSYIDVIDQKSKRLKVLIDDLFEASKMASGNVELIRNRVDITQLLEQALAEFDKDIEKSSIAFRINHPEKPIFAVVDGQKMWRVFDNLIGNILKYSVPNTRAYIDVKEKDSQVIITFKNISNYELSENIDELFERFKRGDESRHTEGSGLGLAISKSIIDLHEGTLDIYVDGDLFKVTIKIG